MGQYRLCEYPAAACGRKSKSNFGGWCHVCQLGSFLVSVSGNINLVIIEHAPSPQTATPLGSLLQHIVCVYTIAGFTVQTILMDIEFEKRT